MVTHGFGGFAITYDLGKITDWVSAIGTVGAVIVSLYLAKQSSKVSAKITYEFVINSQVDPEKPFFVSVQMVNIGSIPIRLAGVVMEYTGRRSNGFPRDYRHTNKVLNYGELFFARFYFEDARNFMRDKRIKKLKVRVVFLDTTGKKFKTKIKILA